VMPRDAQVVCQSILSPRLMFVSLFLLTVGCTLRVFLRGVGVPTILARRILQVSALVEPTALSLFATKCHRFESLSLRAFA